MDCSTPGSPVHHQLLELTQTHVHRVGDAIQPSGRGTRDQIANIRWIVKNQESSRKTFPSALLTMPKPCTVWITINCGKFWEMGIPNHWTCLFRNLYADQEATALTRHGTTDWFQIRKGVCQGCILSPCLFNFYADYIIKMPGWLKRKLESR